MAITRVQGTAGSTNTNVLAYGSNVTAGSLLVASNRVGSTGLTMTCSDNVNGAWTQAYEQDQTTDGHALWVFYHLNAGAGATTVTFTGNGSAGRLLVSEYAGVATSSAIRGSAISAFGAAPLSSGNNTNVVAGDLCYGSATNDNNVSADWTAGGTSAGGSWATDVDFTDPNHMVYSQFVIATVGGSFASFPTQASFVNCTSGLVVFKPPPPPAAPGGMSKGLLPLMFERVNHLYLPRRALWCLA